MLLSKTLLMIIASALIACGNVTATAPLKPTQEPDPIASAPPASVIPSETPRLITAGDLTDTPRPAEPATTPITVITSTPLAWQDLPIVPQGVSDRMRDVYKRGQELGRNPQAFAKVGDCGGTPSWFLGPFDGDPDLYRLGEYTYLQEMIDYFKGSFARDSVATRPGFNTSSIFSSLWADPAQCKPNEGPLICELRLTDASYAVIMMGSNDVWHPDEFEPQMRRAIEDLLERGVVPILATKADDVEQDGSINATIARLAFEYELPLWNFWRAAQALPDHGLQEDGVHLTWAGPRFDDAKAMSHGWPVRNLTALQTLDAVWRGVTK